MTIYFIEMGGSGWIKIGYTAGLPEKRMAQLQTGQPQKLRLLGTIPGELNDERSLHKELETYRGHGEWFNSQPELLSAILDLIKNQRPWFFIRDLRLSKARQERMESEWASAFSISRSMDQSSFDAPMNLFEKARSSKDTKRKLVDLGLEIGGGDLPSWVKRRLSKLNMTPADKYAAAWGRA